MSTAPNHELARCVTLYRLERWEEALASAERAIALGEDTAYAQTFRGLCLRALGREMQAEASFARATTLEPEYVPAHVNRGIALRRLGRAEEAVASYERALGLSPGNFEALSNGAAALLDLKRSEAALAAAAQAIEANPTRPEPHLTRGAALLVLERSEEALEAYARAIELQPGCAGAYAGRAGVLLRLGRSAEALIDSERAIVCDPRLPEAHFNRATALRELGRFDEAHGSFEAAVRLRPHDADAQFSLGCLRLLQGDFVRGWEGYEWRPSLRNRRSPLRPIWRGTEPLAGKVLFIHSEQGLGDTLQFCRYARLAERHAARVALSVPPSLRRLVQSLSPTIEVVDDLTAAAGADYHCSLLSLPRAFSTRLESIPGEVPYLAAEAPRVRSWAERIGPGGYKIGISWQGRAGSQVDIGRSFALARFARLASIPGVRLISLQKNHGVEQLRALPPGMRVETLGPDYDVGTFLETAAIMECLDLIITPDTAIGHLAGALARPGWVLVKSMPDWRWLLGRRDSPWYPTLRLFRQPVAGDWDSVFEAVHRALRETLPPEAADCTEP